MESDHQEIIDLREFIQKLQKEIEDLKSENARLQQEKFELTLRRGGIQDLSMDGDKILGTLSPES